MSILNYTALFQTQVSVIVHPSLALAPTMAQQQSTKKDIEFTVFEHRDTLVNAYDAISNDPSDITNDREKQ